MTQTPENQTSITAISPIVSDEITRLRTLTHCLFEELMHCWNVDLKGKIAKEEPIDAAFDRAIKLTHTYRQMTETLNNIGGIHEKNDAQLISDEERESNYEVFIQAFQQFITYEGARLAGANIANPANWNPLPLPLSEEPTTK